MLENLERQVATQVLLQKESSKFVRYIFFALALTLLLAGENPIAVEAREDMLAVTQVKATESSLYSFHLPHGFHSIAPQSSRHQRRSRRRHSRRPSYKVTGEGIDSKKSGRVQNGAWGGEHIALQVMEQGATFEIDCAHGSIKDPLMLDARGRFNNRGLYMRERGGPEREGQQPETHPARFTGWSDGKRMTLTITLTDTGQTIGDFNLTLGSEPQMTKCL